MVINGEDVFFMKNITSYVEDVTLPEGVGVQTHTYVDGVFTPIEA
jgi:hypothetical protein